jgi:Agglutinin C-terminal
LGTYASVDRVREVLRANVDRFWAVGSTPRYAGFGDQRYYLPSQQEITTLLKDIPLQPVGLFGEVFDCDDYVYVMRGAVSIYGRDILRLQAGLSFGIAWARFGWKPDPLHACNWVVDDTNRFNWIEPQDRNLHSSTECLGGMTLLIV